MKPHVICHMMAALVAQCTTERPELIERSAEALVDSRRRSVCQ